MGQHGSYVENKATPCDYSDRTRKFADLTERI